MKTEPEPSSDCLTPSPLDDLLNSSADMLITSESDEPTRSQPFYACNNSGLPCVKTEPETFDNPLTKSAEDCLSKSPADMLIKTEPLPRYYDNLGLMDVEKEPGTLTFPDTCSPLPDNETWSCNEATEPVVSTDNSSALQRFPVSCSGFNPPDNTSSTSSSVSREYSSSSPYSVTTSCTDESPVTTKEGKLASEPALKARAYRPNKSTFYIKMIAQALMSSKTKQLILSDILAYIDEHYSDHVNNAKTTWKRAVSQHLSLNACFVKGRCYNSGLSSFWAIHPACKEMFTNGDFQGSKARSLAMKMDMATREATGTTETEASLSNQPRIPYVMMIAQALLSSPTHELILSDIFAYIEEHYSDYVNNAKAWKTTISHHLSIDACFVKSRHYNSGPGFFWAIHPACKEMFTNGDFQGSKARSLAKKMDMATKEATGTTETEASLSNQPRIPYVKMIAQALLSSPTHELVLSDIFAYIEEHYSGNVNNAKAPWKRAVSNQLSLNVCFVKGRRYDIGFSSFWTIHPACKEMFTKGDFRSSKAKCLVKKMDIATKEATGTTETEASISNQPRIPYVKMIAQALLSSPTHELILSDIFAYIQEHYSDKVNNAKTPWKRAVSNHLSHSACFVKGGRYNSGLSSFWAIHPACKEMFTNGDFKGSKARSLVKKMDMATREATGTTETEASLSNQPRIPYVKMIAQALLSSPTHELIFSDIFAYIEEHYSDYVNNAKPTWKKDVSQHLSVNACFVKRRHYNSGPGFFWAIHPACKEMFTNGDFQGSKARSLAKKMDMATREATGITETEPSISYQPRIPYVKMIAQALLSSPTYELILSDIFAYIQEHYSDKVNNAKTPWKRAVSNHLSHSACFVKGGRYNSGLRSFWAIHPACKEMFTNGDFQGSKARSLVKKMNMATREATGTTETEASLSNQPRIPYVKMIAQALLTSPTHELILSDIFAYIQEHYSDNVNNSKAPWKRAVSNQLSLNVCFVKGRRYTIGFSSFWTIHPACKEMFTKGDFRSSKSKCLVKKMDMATMEATGTTETEASLSNQPRIPYVKMIAQALLTSPTHELILSDILTYIEEHYSDYVNNAKTSWNRDITRKLHYDACFVKGGRYNGGRRFFWAIHAACKDMFTNGDFRGSKARSLAKKMDMATMETPAS